MIESQNSQDLEEAKKWYALPILVGRVDAQTLARQIANQTTLTTGDVSNVLKTFIDLLPMYMLMGKSVELEGFRSMRISFSSDGVEKEEDFSTKLMRKPRIVFLPSSGLKKRATNEIAYEKMAKSK